MAATKAEEQPLRRRLTWARASLRALIDAELGGSCAVRAKATGACSEPRARRPRQTVHSACPLHATLTIAQLSSLLLGLVTTFVPSLALLRRKESRVHNARAGGAAEEKGHSSAPRAALCAAYFNQHAPESDSTRCACLTARVEAVPSAWAAQLLLLDQVLADLAQVLRALGPLHPVDLHNEMGAIDEKAQDLDCDLSEPEPQPWRFEHCPCVGAAEWSAELLYRRFLRAKGLPGKANAFCVGVCMPYLARYLRQLASALGGTPICAVTHVPPKRRRAVGLHLFVLRRKLEALMFFVVSAAHAPRGVRPSPLPCTCSGAGLELTPHRCPHVLQAYAAATGEQRLHSTVGHARGLEFTGLSQAHRRAFEDWVHTRSPADRDKFKRQMLTINKRVQQITGCVDARQHFSNPLLRAVMLVSGTVYYTVRGRAGRARGEFVTAQGDLSLQTVMWNMQDEAFVKFFFGLGLPFIAANRLVHIPPLQAARTRWSHPTVDVPTTVQVRVLFHSKLKDAPPTARHGEERLLVGTASPSDYTRILPDSAELRKVPVILHFHGGGWVGMSSFSHQNYTRQWANGTRHLVVSVDYRKAPEHPFPAAVDDCCAAYAWVINGGLARFGMQPSSVVLVGDSAGGNLAAAVTVKLLHLGWRPPSGVVLCYPATSLETAFTPSMLLSLDDTMIAYSFIKGCMEAYLTGPDVRGSARAALNERTAGHPLASPLVASCALLRKFPPTRIMVGTADPLCDSAFIFAQRLRALDVDVELALFEDFPHGFLSFDFVMAPYRKDTQLGIQQGVRWFRELAGKPP